VPGAFIPDRLARTARETSWKAATPSGRTLNGSDWMTLASGISAVSGEETVGTTDTFKPLRSHCDQMQAVAPTRAVSAPNQT
jgi:hypothetical protein